MADTQQKINLYYGDLLPPPERIPIVYLGLAVVVGLVFAFADFWWAYSELRAAYEKREESQAQQAALRAQLTHLESQVPSAVFRARMTQRIQRLQQMLAKSQGTIELINDLQKRQKLKYSQLLTDLEKIPEQVWLTAFRVDHRGLRLEGATRKDEQVAEMIRRLQGLPSTTHLQYGVIRLEADENNRVLRHFVVAPLGEKVNESNN